MLRLPNSWRSYACGARTVLNNMVVKNILGFGTILRCKNNCLFYFIRIFDHGLLCSKIYKLNANFHGFLSMNTSIHSSNFGLLLFSCVLLEAVWCSR